MNLLYSAEETDLRSAVRSLLETAPEGESWDGLARSIGAAGLLVPEAYGGAGASAREAAVVMEEIGRATASVPFLGSAVLATSALLACEPVPPVTELLGELASGAVTACLVVPYAAAPYAPAPLADPEALVADATAADVFLVSTSEGLYAVPASSASVSPVTSLDETRPLARVAWSGGTLLSPGSAAAVRQALLTGAGLLASEQLGIAEWCLETTVAYLKERKQFGRAVGSFQALKHRLADLWLEVAQARAAARAAADALASSPPSSPPSQETALSVAVAQAYCAPMAVHAAEECVQLHGGIGFTWEHPAHRYLKRAKADEIALGTPGRHRAALADLADLPPPHQGPR